MKYNLGYLTTEEAKITFSKSPAALIPLGSTEQHGPHAMMGDYLVVEKLANEIAEVTKVTTLPTIPFSYSPYFANYSGTITLQRNTLTSLLTDTCLSLKNHGVQTIIFLNGHSGNQSIIEEVSRCNTDKNFHIYSISIWNVLSQQDKEEIYKEVDPSGHGGEPLTSLYLHYFPHHSKKELLPIIVDKGQWQGKDVSQVSSITINGISVHRYFNLDDISSNGVLGNPNNSSAIRGSQLAERIIKNTSHVINEIIALDYCDRESE